MTYSFRPAAASEAKPLVGLYAESGCGKTKSALLLAKGFAGDMAKVGMIETESGRGEAYANDPVVGGYRVLPLRGDFSPKAYGQAIGAAEAASLQALIIDSASHEWEGVGGVLAMAAANQADGKKGVLVWQKPKIEHQREFMGRLMQTPIPLVIVCMRAKYPMEEKVAGGKKDWVRSENLEPKQSDDILYEMFVHAWIDRAHNLHVTKFTLDEEMRRVFSDGEPITVDTGKRLAAWAAGRPSVSAPKAADETGAPTSAAPRSSAPGRITAEQKAELERECDAALISVTKVCDKAKIFSLDEMEAEDFDAALAWVRKVAASRAPDEAATLRKIEAAKDREAAAEILDTCRNFPFYDRLSSAFVAQWGQ